MLKNGKEALNGICLMESFMINKMRYALSVLLLLAFSASIFSMLAPVTRAQKRDALGIFYGIFMDATTANEKIMTLLLASKMYEHNSPQYQILQDMLLERGFDPNVENADELIIQYFKADRKRALEQANFQTVEEKVDFLHAQMRPVDAEGAFAHQNLVNQAMQLLIDEVYKDEV